MERAALLMSSINSAACQPQGPISIVRARQSAKDMLPDPVSAITAPSLNLTCCDSTNEIDTTQISAGYAKTNFGSLDINWTEGTVTLSIHASDGATVEETTDKFR